MTRPEDPRPREAPEPAGARGREIISRRTLLATTAKLAIAAAVGVLGLRRAGAGQNASPDFDAFMAVSRRLTGKNDLDPVVGARLHAALIRKYPGLPSAVAPLGTRLPAADRAADTSLAALPEAERTAAQHILRGWYLGVVGVDDDPDAECVAYETILAYRPVADQVVMQTFCREVPGYWAEPPSALQAARV